MCGRSSVTTATSRVTSPLHTLAHVQGQFPHPNLSAFRVLTSDQHINSQQFLTGIVSTGTGRASSHADYYGIVCLEKIIPMFQMFMFSFAGVRLEKKWDKGKAQNAKETFKKLDKVGADRAD